MNGKPLKKVQLARLSPVMHAYGKPFIRKEQFVPIKPAHIGIGNYEGNVQTIDPRKQALWSNLYRIGAAGSLSRVTPFGPGAFGSENDGIFGNNNAVTVQNNKKFLLGTAIGALLSFGALTLLGVGKS